ncbi:hypothetical protein CYMTET_18769 [Cymbomonas tetramitiformis]|uniref:Uncharacterized protein n=1 Tax=Cymbomonas tetramitiformis TaxID=36881 RepID=A0AAE0G7F3_9CHLO|nr:hypothetical protein CYMTET_18769 [Cymbomonas tetramitiformis]
MSQDRRSLEPLHIYLLLEESLSSSHVGEPSGLAQCRSLPTNSAMGNVEAEATASRKEQVQKEEEDVASRGRLESLEEDQLEHVNSLRLVNKHLNTEVESLSAKLKAVEAERDGLQSLLSRLGEQLRVERLAHAKLKRLDSNASSTGDGEAVATLMASEDVADAGEMATQASLLPSLGTAFRVSLIRRGSFSTPYRVSKMFVRPRGLQGE